MKHSLLANSGSLMCIAPAIKTQPVISALQPSLCEEQDRCRSEISLNVSVNGAVCVQTSLCCPPSRP